MPIIGEASIQIRALDKFFERDVRNSVKRLKNVGIDLKVDADISKASKKIRDLRYRINSSKPAVMYFDANVEKAREKLKTLFDNFNEKELSFTAKAYTAGANTKLKELRDRYTKTPLNFTAAANTKIASAQIAWAARSRTVPFKIRVDNKTLAGAINILAGLLPFETISNGIKTLIADFDKISGKALSVISAVGALSASLLTLGGNVLNIALDLGKLVGAAALIPALFSAGTAVILANAAAWDGFMEAVQGSEEALAKLPPNARAAAVAIRGTWDSIQRPVQKAFWEEMNTSLQDTVEAILPAVRRGLTETGRAIGEFTSRGLASFRNFAENGSLDKVFEGINQGLQNVNRGIRPFLDALGILNVRGAAFLPRFGTGLANAAESFRRFIVVADEAGRINVWIESAITQAKNLSSIFVSATTIVRDLGRAADLAGSSGLDELAAGFRNVADIVGGEPFQSRLITVLEGAREGTRRLGEGFRDLTRLVGNSSIAINGFLTITGEIAGQALSSVSDLFSGTRLGGGLMKGLYGINDGLAIMEPGFRNLGNIIGDLAEIAGSFFENMAVGLEIFLGTVEGVVSQLKDGILAVMPILNAFVQSILLVTQGPLEAFAGLIGDILEGFARLPGPIQTATAVLGAFLLLRHKFGTFFSNIGIAGQRAFQTVSGAAVAGQVGLTGYQRSLGRVRDAVSRANLQIGTMQTRMAIGGAATGLSQSIGGVTRSIGAVGGRGLMAAGSGLMSLLGGPWGLAIGAGIGIMSAFGQVQQAADERVRALSASLDQQTGRITELTRTQLAENWLDLDTNAWDDFVRGVFDGAKSITETLETVGLTAEEVNDKLADPAGRSEYLASWQRITDALNSSEVAVNKYGVATGNQIEITDEMAAAVGMSKEEILKNAESLVYMNGKLQSAGAELTKAEQKVKDLAAATGTSTTQAAMLAENYETLASTTSSVTQKFSALKSNLDILNDGQMSAVDTQKNYQQSLSDTADAIDAVVVANNGSIQGLVDTQGQFDLTSQAGRDLHTAFSDSADAILRIGVEAYDAALKQTGSVQEAQATAMAAMAGPLDTFRQSLEALGLSTPQINAIIDTLGLVPEEVKTALLANGDQALQEAARVQLALDAYANGEYEAVLAALPQQAKDAIAQATGLGTAFANGDFTAILEALDKTGPGKEQALAALLTVADGDYEAWLEAYDNTKPGVDAATANVTQGFGVLKESADLTAIDGTKPTLTAATAGVVGFGVLTEEALLLAANRTEPEVSNAIANLNRPQDVYTDLWAVNMTAKDVQAAQGTMNSLDSVFRDLNATNKTVPPKIAAQKTMNSLADVSRDLWAVNMAGAPKASAQRTMDSLRDTTRDLWAVNKTHSAKNSAQGTMNSLRNVFRDLYARNQTYAGVNSAQRSINSVRGRTVTVLTNHITRYITQGQRPSGSVRGTYAYADGGILGNKGVAKFANGGLMSALGGNVKSFAGGSEKHIAQISKGKWPYRIWSEPETGGEAYIPLGSSKRPRSLAILDEVAKQFGFGLFKKFADGGIMDALNTPTASTTSFTPSTATRTVGSVGNGDNRTPMVINNYYPKAEPTSTTIQKASNILGLTGSI